MKTNVLLVAACAAALSGCDYTVALIGKPSQPLDAALVGVWERTTLQGEQQRLLILPLSKTEYLLSFPADTKDAMFARVTQNHVAGHTLLQLAWFGTAKGVTPADERIYQYATFTVTGDKLKGRLLNADVIDRDTASADTLIAAIEANREKPNLFRDAWEFTRATPPEDPNRPLKRPPIPAAWR